MRCRAARRLLIYAGLVLLLASLRAWQVHSAPFDCSDGAGHGPDPDTSECARAIAHAREHRSEETLNAFVAIVVLGVVGLGAYGALRLSMRIEIVKRFAHGDPL